MENDSTLCCIPIASPIAPHIVLELLDVVGCIPYEESKSCSWIDCGERDWSMSKNPVKSDIVLRVQGIGIAVLLEVDISLEESIR